MDRETGMVLAQKTVDAVAVETAEDGVVARKNPARAYMENLKSEASRVTMGGVLRRIVAEAAALNGTAPVDIYDFNWGALRYDHTSSIAAALRKSMAPATFNKHLAGLRRVLKFARRGKHMSAQEYIDACDIENAELDEGSVAGRAVEQEEIQKLVDACEGDERDVAIVMVLALGGLRRAELASLKRRHYDGSSLTFKGKRNKLRKVPVDGIAQHLDAWLKKRGDIGPDEPIFVGQRGTELTDKGVYAILKRLQAASGVASVSPHDMRRGFITTLLDLNVDVLTVSKMAGHSSPATTRKYDRRGEKVARAAAAQLKVPTVKTSTASKESS